MVFYFCKGVSEFMCFILEVVVEKYGFIFRQYLDFVVLCGDFSDNLFGIFGVGEKIVVKWIVEYGLLWLLVDNVDVVCGKVGDVLWVNLVSVVCNCEFIDLVCDVLLVQILDMLWLQFWDCDYIYWFFDDLEFWVLCDWLFDMLVVVGGFEVDEGFDVCGGVLVFGMVR